MRPRTGLLLTVLVGAAGAAAVLPARGEVVRVAAAAPTGGRSTSAGAPARESVPATGEAAEVVERAKDYRSWARFSRYDQAKPSKAHGGVYVIAWYNAAAAPAVKGGDYPDGSVIVKENRPAPDAPPAALTVMSKRSGSWYWLKATPEWKVAVEKGKPLAGTEVSSCVGCHDMAPGDMVFSK